MVLAPIRIATVVVVPGRLLAERRSPLPTPPDNQPDEPERGEDEARGLGNRH